MSAPSISRRELLKAAALLGSASALAGLSAFSPARAANNRIPWRNWSGAQSCLPAERIAPASEAALADYLRQAKHTVRPVGAAHSFSPLVPTANAILSTAKLSGMICYDQAKLTADYWAGTPMSSMGAELQAIGMGLINMADIDYQTLAGAIATSTHGTGISLGSYSTQVAGIRLITANGESLDCDAEHNADIFNAARVSLGSLGVQSRIRMQCRPAYKLKETMWLAKLEDVLANIDQHLNDNRHFEMQVITGSDYAAAIALNESTEDYTQPVDPEEEGGNEYVALLKGLHHYAGNLPSLRRGLLNLVGKTVSFPERVGDSWDIFANVRNVRFNEMEYAVPAEAGPDCLREIMQTIKDRQLPTWFPIEYRYIKGDDIWLSQFQGRDSAAISIHQHYEMSYHDYFNAIEPIFWKYEGRPHWGKLHSLNHHSLKALYPHWQDFNAVRESLDPSGKFLNGHLRSVFGA